MKKICSLFETKSLPVIEDVTLITLEKGAGNLELSAESYGPGNIQPLRPCKTAFWRPLIPLKRDLKTLIRVQFGRLNAKNVFALGISNNSQPAQHNLTNAAEKRESINVISPSPCIFLCQKGKKTSVVRPLSSHVATCSKLILP